MPLKSTMPRQYRINSEFTSLFLRFSLADIGNHRRRGFKLISPVCAGVCGSSQCILHSKPHEHINILNGEFCRGDRAVLCLFHRNGRVPSAAIGNNDSLNRGAFYVEHSVFIPKTLYNWPSGCIKISVFQRLDNSTVGKCICISHRLNIKGESFWQQQ